MLCRLGGFKEEIELKLWAEALCRECLCVVRSRVGWWSVTCMGENGIVVLFKQHLWPFLLLALPLYSVLHLLWPTFPLWCIEHVEIKGVLLLTLVVQKWGTEEVAAWLDLLNLGEYREIFIRHDIRGAELLHLERRDLKVFLLCYPSALEIFLAKPNPFSCAASVMCL